MIVIYYNYKTAQTCSIDHHPIFGVDDVSQAVDHFVQQGCTKNQPGDDIVVATVRRLNGQLIGLIYNPHFK